MQAFDLKKYEEDIDKVIAEKFNACLMSNSKWQKLFYALDTENILIEQVLLKTVNREQPFQTYMPKTEDLETMWVSEGKNDCNYFYKEIEWIELLYRVKKGQNPYTYLEQTIASVELILNSIGKFEIAYTDSGLRIYGYKPNPSFKRDA